MQEGLRERVQARQSSGRWSPSPVNHPLQKRTWLGSNTVKTVSKDTRNKKQTRPSISIFKVPYYPISQTTLPQTILLIMQIKQSCNIDIWEYLLQWSEEQMSKLFTIHSRNDRKAEQVLHPPAPAYSLYSQYKLTFGMEF